MKVFAFVVTYNRLNLLKKTIDCLRKQSYPIDKLFIVNNGSTDGTDVWLSQQKDLMVINQDNVGGAGGFYRGVKFAYENNADWIWMMDDDVFPEPYCLEKLLEYRNVSKCIQPARFHSDGVYIQWGYNYILEKDLEVKVPSENHSRNCFSVNVGCFEGMLIHRSVVEKIGYPDARFFITSDDRIYGYLASHYTNVVLVRDAKLIRSSLSHERKISPLYIYYIYRNFHLRSEYCKKISGKEFSLMVKSKYIAGAFKRMLFGYKDIDKSLNMSLKIALLRGVLDCFKRKIGKTY